MPEIAPQGKLVIGRAGLILFCGLLMAFSSLSVDIMLPAFLKMSEDLQAPLTWVQGTIPVFIFGSALGQLFYGSFSDRFGRKPALAFGLMIFLTGAVIAAIGGNIETVLLGRGIQGFGAATGPVIGRAILRDTYSGPALGQAMAGSMAIFSIGPIVAPLLGFAIISFASWRYIFVALVAVSFALLLANFTWFEESNRHKNPNALSLKTLIAALKAVMANSQSRTFLLLACAAYCALLSYVANSSRVYIEDLGAGELEFAVLFAVTGLGIIIGQIANRRALRSFGILTSVRAAGCVLLAASSLTAIMAYHGGLTALWLTVLMFMFNTSFLVVLSNSLTLIIDPHPTIAGFVSSLFGALTTASGAIFAASTFELFEGDALKWGIGMTVMTFISCVGFLLVKRKSLNFDQSTPG